MENPITSGQISGKIAFHIIYNDLHLIDRNEAEDKIACDILSGILPPVTEKHVKLAWEVVEDLRKEYNE